MFTFLLVALLLQGDPRVHCSPPGSVRNCRADDGSRYVEIRSGDRLTRQWTDPSGNTWTELIDFSSSGARLSGYDSRGRTWYQTCRPEFGTMGSDRTGKSISLPPRRTEDGYEPCYGYTPLR